MKKFFNFILIITILLIIPTTSNAQVNTFDRNEANNYGVNKHWNINDNNIGNVTATPYVDAKDKIYDFSDILTEEEEKELYNKIQQFITTTNMDMVIVTYNLPYTIDSKNEVFAADFYDYNDFGLDLENYSGVLLFRNTYELDRYYDIYTFGNAQLYFGYDRLNYILDNIYYDFVNDNYLSGMTTFINNLNDYYEAGIDSDYKDYYVDKDGYLQKKYTLPIVTATIISSIVTIIAIIVLVNKNKMVKKASKADEYLLTNSINYSQKEDKFAYSRTSSYRVSSSSGGGGGGGSSRGSSGGGHSSGGGRHG